MWQTDRARISSTMLCEMYAVSFVFWRCSNALQGFGQPDMAFAWNTAVVALRDDLLAPCMTTVHACLLAITGRPTIGVTGNVVKAGSMITLAHSLALHRDPTSWQIPQAEKRIRINVWWAVVIHDYWSSIAHGTPPNIRQEHYDVPLPALDGESDGTSPSFRHLCSVSEILGDTLPLIYALRMEQKEAEKRVRRIECKIDAWVDDLPGSLKASSSGTQYSKPEPKQKRADHLPCLQASMGQVICGFASYRSSSCYAEWPTRCDRLQALSRPSLT